MEILLLTALLVLSTDGNQTRPIHPGQNITLTGPDCSANASVTVRKAGNGKYIYYYIDGHAIVQHHQDPSFVGRVKRTEDAIVSVTLMNVTRGDAGEIKLSCRNSDGTKFDYRYDLKVTDGGAADGGNTSGNTTSGNTTSGDNTSGDNTSGDNTSGIPPDVGAIVGGIVAVLGIVMIITGVSLCGSRFSCRIPCRLSDQLNSELPATYREVKQQQV